MANVLLFESPLQTGNITIGAGTVADDINDNRDTYEEVSINAPITIPFVGVPTQLYLDTSNVKTFTLSINGTSISLSSTDSHVQNTDLQHVKRYYLSHFAPPENTASGNSVLTITEAEDRSKPIRIFRAYLLRLRTAIDENQVTLPTTDNNSRGEIIHESINYIETVTKPPISDKRVTSFTTESLTHGQVATLEAFRRAHPNFVISEDFDYMPEGVYKARWGGEWSKIYFAYKQAGIDLSFNVIER